MEDKLLNKLRKKYDEISSRSKGSDFFKFKSGENNVRIVYNPETVGEDDLPFLSVYVHFNLGPDGKSRAVCPKHLGVSECPGCDRHDELKALPDAASKERAKDIRAKEQVYYHIIDKNDPRNPVLRIMNSGPKLLEDILNITLNPKYGNIFRLDTGRDLMIKFTEKGNSKSGYNEYTPMADPDRTAVEGIDLSKLSDLKVFAKPDSVDKINALLSGDTWEDLPRVGDDEGGHDVKSDTSESPGEDLDIERVLAELRKRKKVA